MHENYIYCDGSTLNNGQPGVKKSGVGAVLICGGERHLISRAVDPDDSNRVEIKAATLALIRALIVCPEIADQPVILYSDSEYFVDRFNYIVQQTDPDDVWHELRRVSWLFRELKVKTVARSRLADTTIHAEADRLAKVGAGMYGSQYPNAYKPPTKPVKANKNKGEFVLSTWTEHQAKATKTTFYAGNMRHAIAQMVNKIPHDSCRIEIEKW